MEAFSIPKGSLYVTKNSCIIRMLNTTVFTSRDSFIKIYSAKYTDIYHDRWESSGTRTKTIRSHNFSILQFLSGRHPASDTNQSHCQQNIE